MALPFFILLSGVKGDTRRYRTFHPYEQLRLAGVDCLLSHITDPELPTKIRKATVALFHRTAFDSHVERLLQTLSKQDGLALYDVDDLIFDPAAFSWITSPDFQDPIRARLYIEDMHRQRITLEACQAVIASTDFLARQVRALGKASWVHRNAFSYEMLAYAEQALLQVRPKNNALVIGYASGTRTHDLDFEVAKPALKQTLQRYPKAQLWLVGHIDPGKDWGALAARIRHYRAVPWRRLPQLLAQFDINLAPLVTNNPFAQSKSEIKYMEAALVQVPTVASPTEAFQYAIHSGDNGFLASDEQEWVNALSRLIEDANLRREMGLKAYMDVMERYHPQARSAELVITLNQIYQTFRGEPLWETLSLPQAMKESSHPAHFWVAPQVESAPSLVQMGLYTLQQRGLLTLLKQIWIYFRRLIAPLIPFKKPYA
jgi:glycosyltransferase involved in cell wall biosynthesis